MVRLTTMTARLAGVGISYHAAMSILTPTNARTNTMAYLSLSNLPSMAASAKYSERSPRIAMMLLVKTINGSSVTPKMAGMESIAKSTSEVSMTMRASMSGVMNRLPFSLTKNA